MKYLEWNDLDKFRNSKKQSYVSLSESLRNAKNESTSQKTTIFLSHKHDEKEQLEAVIGFLKAYGVNVYVDWMDEGMPETTSGITAQKLKEKIKSNDKFILLGTHGAINSKWCNWELGLGDAAKYINDIAIIPVLDQNYRFHGSEYLQIYPVIEMDDLEYKAYVKYSSGNRESLLT